MAKYETDLEGSFIEFRDYIKEAIISSSSSVTLEDVSSLALNAQTFLQVYVFERYSFSGNNRVSLNLTILAQENSIHLIAITAGGSQAVFFKMNTLGEEAFLDKVKAAVAQYKQK